MWAIFLKYVEPILSWIILGTVVVWLVYAGAVKPVVNPTPTTTQTGGVSYNYQIKLGMLSCARIPTPQDQVASAVKPVTDKVKNVVAKTVK